MKAQLTNISPRVGLACDVHRQGKTSIRSGFGTFYDFVPAGFFSGLNSMPPFKTRVTLFNVKIDDPFADFPGGNPFPYFGGPDATFPLANYGILNPDTKNQSVVQWNLSVQRQLGTNWLVSASYLGANSTHLWALRSMNSAVFLGLGPCTLNGVQYAVCSTTANTDQRRALTLENPQVGKNFSFLQAVDDGGTGSYNGLVLSAQRRASRGITLNVNYTWSHCIGDRTENIALGGTGDGSFTNPENRRFDRGNCTTSATDRRHIFNVSGVAETPGFSNRTLRAVGSGWRLSPIIRVLSGSHLTITSGVDGALTAVAGQRVNQILPNVYGDKSVARYLNPAAFAQPTAGTLGNSGMGSILGPSTWQFDAAISRAFRLGELKRLEFRAEAFNVTNSFRMDDPQTAFNSPSTFGQVRSAKDPRIMQFALKYVF